MRKSMQQGCCWRRAPFNVRIPFTLLFAVCILVVGSIDSARASIAVHIHLSQQTMNVAIDDTDIATWRISTARRGYRTPIGICKPHQLERMHHSRLYNYTPMPYSLFFHGGYAIHGTTEIRNLGHAVSHGCTRLSPDNARSLFELVQIHGLQNITIEISE